MINKGSPLKPNHLECIFMCLLSVCISFFLNKYLFNSFAHFSIELSFCYWIVRGFLIHSGHWVLTRYMTSKYFLTFWRLTFYFLGNVLWCIILKKFWWSSIPLFFLFSVLVLVLLLSNKNMLKKLRSWKLLFFKNFTFVTYSVHLTILS